MTTATQSKPSSMTGAAIDPLSQTPYTAPDSAAPQLPEITAPTPPQQSSPPAEGPRVPNTGMGRAGGIAFLASRVLKGMGQGHMAAEQVKAQRQKRLLDGLQFSYNNAAEKYADLKKRGVTGKELDDAKAAVDSSWAAMMQVYSRYFGGDTGKDGKKKKGKQGDQPANPMEGLTSQDPKTKAQAWYTLAMKSGPPVYYQTSAYDTPEYKQQKEKEAKQTQIELDNENKFLRLHELEKKSSLTDPEKEELKNLQEDQELFKFGSSMTPHYATFDTLGSDLPAGTLDANGQPVDVKKHYRRVDRAGVTSWEPAVPKASAATKPIFAWTREPGKNGRIYSVEVDPETNQFKKGTENYDKMPPAYLIPHIRESEFPWTDADRNLHRAKTYSMTAPVIPGVRAPAEEAPAEGAPTKSEAPAAAPAKGETPAAAPSKGGAAATPQPTKKTAGFLGEGEIGPLGIRQSAGDRIIGNVGAQGQTKSRAEAAESVLRILPNALKLLKDPNVQKNLGVFNGRWSEIEKKVGNLDPKTQEFYGTLKSIYALNGSMHGWRSLKAPAEFEVAYGDLHTDPKTLLGGLRAVSSTAKDVYETGFHHPWRGTGGATPSSTPSSTPPSTGDPKNADEYLKHIHG